MNFAVYTVLPRQIQNFVCVYLYKYLNCNSYYKDDDRKLHVGTAPVCSCTS